MQMHVFLGCFGRREIVENLGQQAKEHATDKERREKLGFAAARCGVQTPDTTGPLSPLQKVESAEMCAGVIVGVTKSGQVDPVCVRCVDSGTCRATSRNSVKFQH